MVLKDFFWFDETAYRNRIRGYSSSHLLSVEIGKTRQSRSGRVYMLGGNGASAFTYGASLITATFGSRRYHVAERKLKILRKEIKSRGLTSSSNVKKNRNYTNGATTSQNVEIKTYIAIPGSTKAGVATTYIHELLPPPYDDGGKLSPSSEPPAEKSVGKCRNSCTKRLQKICKSWDGVYNHGRFPH